MARRPITDYLSHGAQNAISAADLTKIAGVESRDIRRIVEAERIAGAVILSDERGYYLPNENREAAIFETTAWIARRLETAKTYELTVRAARTYLAKLRVE